MIGSLQALVGVPMPLLLLLLSLAFAAPEEGAGPNVAAAPETSVPEVPTGLPAGGEPLFTGVPDKFAGVRVGLTTASMYGRKMDDSTVRPGFAVGWWKARKLVWIWHYQYEVTYVQKGAKFADFSDEYQHLADTRVYANYLELPFLIRTKVPVPKMFPVKPYTVTGVYGAVRLSGKQGDEKDRIESWSLFDVGYYAGGGSEIYLKDKYAFSLDTRVGIGKMSVDLGNHIRMLTVVMTGGASF